RVARSTTTGRRVRRAARYTVRRVPRARADGAARRAVYSAAVGPARGRRHGDGREEVAGAPRHDPRRGAPAAADPARRAQHGRAAASVGAPAAPRGAPRSAPPVTRGVALRWRRPAPGGGDAPPRGVTVQPSPLGPRPLGAGADAASVVKSRRRFLIFFCEQDE